MSTVVPFDRAPLSFEDAGRVPEGVFQLYRDLGPRQIWRRWGRSRAST